MKTRIDEALIMAVEAHEGQTDKSGKPYILHPLAVFSILRNNHEHCHWEYKEFTLEDMLIAALLHDVVEDTPVTLTTIKAKFGDQVAAMVEGVTRKKAKSETYKVFIVRAKSFHPGSRLIKMADIQHNLSRIHLLPEKERSIGKRYLDALEVLRAD